MSTVSTYANASRTCTLAVFLMFGITGCASVSSVSRMSNGSVSGPISGVAATRDGQQVVARIDRTLHAAKIDRQNIFIEFSEGVAVLSGTISDDKARRKATRVVSRINGVRWIDNQLKLQSDAGGLLVESHAELRGEVVPVSAIAPYGFSVQQVITTDPVLTFADEPSGPFSHVIAVFRNLKSHVCPYSTAPRKARIPWPVTRGW